MQLVVVSKTYHIYRLKTILYYIGQLTFSFPFVFLGLIRQPKWGHLKDLHKAIKMCEAALVSGDPIVTSLGSSQEVRMISILFQFGSFAVDCMGDFMLMTSVDPLGAYLSLIQNLSHSYRNSTPSRYLPKFHSNWIHIDNSGLVYLWFE